MFLNKVFIILNVIEILRLTDGSCFHLFRPEDFVHAHSRGVLHVISLFGAAVRGHAVPQTLHFPAHRRRRRLQEFHQGPRGQQGSAD